MRKEEYLKLAGKARKQLVKPVVPVDKLIREDRERDY